MAADAMCACWLPSQAHYGGLYSFVTHAPKHTLSSLSCVCQEFCHSRQNSYRFMNVNLNVEILRKDLRSGCLKSQNNGHHSGLNVTHRLMGLNSCYSTGAVGSWWSLEEVVPRRGSWLQVDGPRGLYLCLSSSQALCFLCPHVIYPKPHATLARDRGHICRAFPVRYSQAKSSNQSFPRDFFSDIVHNDEKNH